MVDAGPNGPQNSIWVASSVSRGTTVHDINKLRW